jgi:hypothetical protein
MIGPGCATCAKLVQRFGDGFAVSVEVDADDFQVTEQMKS